MSNSKAPYKKVACRHFDAHSGKPLSPCTKGSDCSFLHPSDFEWSRRNTAKKTYRSAPLAPQADLFLRSHREELSSNSRTQEGRKPSKGSLGLKYRKRSGTPDRDRSLFQDTPTPMERNKPVVENSRRQEFVRMGENTRTRNITEEIKKPAKPSFSETGHASKERPTEKPDASPKTIPVTVNVQNSDKVVRLFQGLASISRETDQLSEVQKKEESKIETYKNISATLKSITSSAGSAVAPQMALSLLAQTECKNRIEKNNATCQKMWSDAINVFVEEVTKVVDNRVQVVLRCIRNEAEQAALSIGARISARERTTMQRTLQEARCFRIWALEGSLSGRN
ncbi:hypothetical protein CPB84DRAFT_894812 [Gymnopilus junonius]|uniref:C3H1-type domain-containing protein n=1 Tax=Gymnopilus junonius TaxID=109634 RepID=A0A9P5TN20_GYMJU|nr:hypothetical protein CPB84DRAFT_894812 [Gymnopilus junonius]